MISVITADKPMGREVHTEAYVMCLHCAARGSSMVEEKLLEAVRGARKHWNEAKR